MRLLFVTHSFPPPDHPLENIGGMQRVASELHHALVATGGRGPDGEPFSYDVHALVSTWKWVHWRVVPFLLTTLLHVRRLVRRGEVDVVLFSSMVTALIVLFLGRSTSHSLENRRNGGAHQGVMLASVVHGRDITKPLSIYQHMVRRVFARLDLVLPVSSATGQACLDRGLPRDKLHVVHNGVNIRRFTPVINGLKKSPTFISRDWKRVFRSTRHVPSNHARSPGSPSDRAPDPMLLCGVGRHVERKGYAWFIREVMPLLPDTVHFWLGGEGPEREHIERAVTEANLSHRVRLLGRLDEWELVDLYRTADLFVMPNIPVPGDMEGFGIVMLEAGLLGLPTIAAHLEGIREVISPGRNGYFVESGDAAGFSECIRALQADRDALRKLSRATRTHVTDSFSWERVAKNYLSALSATCSRISSR